MLGGILSMAAAALAVSSADVPAAKAADVAKTYDIHVTIEQDGKVTAKPRLLAKAGQAAAFVSFTGNDHIGIALKITATPDATTAAGPDGVNLAFDLLMQPSAAVREHTTSTATVKPGALFKLKVPARDASPAINVQVSASLLPEPKVASL